MIPLISAIMPMVGEVVDRLVPDKAGAAKAKQDLEAKLVDAAMAGQLGNLEINKVEAAHRSIWVSGWRPGVGWCCSLAFAFHFVVFPVLCRPYFLLARTKQLHILCTWYQMHTNRELFVT